MLRVEEVNTSKQTTHTQTQTPTHIHTYIHTHHPNLKIISNLNISKQTKLNQWTVCA